MLYPLVVTVPAISPQTELILKLYPSTIDEVCGIIPDGALQQSQSNSPIFCICSTTSETFIPNNGCIIPIIAIVNFGLIRFIFCCASFTSAQVPFWTLSMSALNSHSNGCKSMLHHTENV